jgi:hypothetical protein
MYESDATLYKVAAVTAAAASVMIMRPWAFYVTAMIGTMVSNPGGMAQSAKNWKSLDHQGLMGELDELDAGLVQLKKQLKEAGKWEGTAADTFEGIHKSFMDAIKSLKETRNNTGDAVGTAAEVYHYGAIVCTVVAGSMFILGVYLMASRGTPLTAVFAEGISSIRGAMTMQAVKKVLMKHLMVAGALGGVLYMTIQQTEMTGKLFPGLEASIPTEMSDLQSGGMPPFSDAGMTYDEKMGGLTVKMDDSLTSGKVPGAAT